MNNVICFNDIVAWATPASIRFIHYGKKQKICIIERPKKCPHFPEYLYTSTAVKPSIIWRKEE